MENLRRLGGDAGVLAGLATAWLFLGLILVFPSAGLSLADQLNPHRYLTFIAKHQTMFWTVNVPGGFVAALLTAVLLLAMGDHFRDHAPASARIGPLLGIFGAAGFAAAALIRQVGFGALSTLYVGNKVGAAYAFYALNGMVNSLVSLGDVATGLGVLILGNVMLRTKRYGHVGYLSVVAGTAMVFSAFIAHVFLFMASFVAIIAWLLWTALTLRAEVGSALFRRVTERRKHERSTSEEQRVA